MPRRLWTPESGLSRRDLLRLAGAAAITGAVAPLAGCLPVDPSSRLWPALAAFEGLNRRVLGGGGRARTYPESAISPRFRVNSLVVPDEHAALAANGWLGWRLVVDGLVKRPAAFPLDELRYSFAPVTQVTRLDCVEGWSCIGSWTGLRLADLLAVVGVLPRARYVVCHAADEDEDGTPFYGSLDLDAARHPQTLLAYGMNRQVPLPLDHGAPLRLLLPTQLGYKSTKFIVRMSLVERFSDLAGGKGGYWEDQGYEWYAGI